MNTKSIKANDVTDLDTAIEYTIGMLGSDVEKELSNISEDDFTAQAHRGLGTFIRNSLNLWSSESVLVIWFKKTYQIAHADDMSGIILRTLYRRIKNKPLHINKQVKKYLDYWKNSE